MNNRDVFTSTGKRLRGWHYVRRFTVICDNFAIRLESGPCIEATASIAISELRARA